MTGSDSRKGFIDKETDTETNAANHGVRQYDAETGRFSSVDPLWEKFPSESPYHYSFNNPLLLADADGAAPIIAPFLLPAVEALGVAIAGAIAVKIAVEILEEGMNFSEWMRMPSVSTSVDPMSATVSFSLGNGSLLSTPEGYINTQEGQWALMFALMAASGGGDDEAPNIEPPFVPEANSPDRGMTSDQRALKDIVNGATKGGRYPLPKDEAEIILDWADEVNYPGRRAKPGDVASPSNWDANPVPDIHIPGAGRNGHVPVEEGVQPR